MSGCLKTMVTQHYNYFLEISDSDRPLDPRGTIGQHLGGDDEDTVEPQYDKVLREWQMCLL